jgi:hypothetical protein
MKRQIFFCKLLLIAITCHSQELIIYGDVTEANNVPIESAYILLMKSDSITYVNSTMTDIDGKFRLILPDNDNYVLFVNHILFNDFVMSVQNTDSLIHIKLEKKDFILNEVTVTSTYQKAVIFKEGSLIYSPSGIGITPTDNAFTLLEKMPSIEITSSDEILLNGKIVSFEINDQKRNYSGSTFISVLKSLPGNQIKEIVIKPNSTAENQANMMGTINIITKRIDDSFLITVGGKSSYKNKNIDGAGSVFFAIQKSKSYVDINIGIENEYMKNEEYQDIFYYNNEHGNGYNKFIGRNKAILGNINYELDLNNYKLTSSFLTFFDKGDRDIIANYKYFNQDAIIKEESLDSGKRTFNEKLHTASVGLKSNDTNDFYHGLNYEIIWGESRNSTGISNNTSYNNQNIKSNTEITNPHNGFQHIFNYDINYRKKSNEIKFGFRLDFGKLSPETVYDSIINNKIIKSDLYSTKYNINENIYATYLSFKTKLNSRLSMTIGGRAEYTDMEAKSLYDNIRTRYRKLHLFPFASISGEFKNYASSVNFSSSIDRPPFNYYIPNYRYTSKYIYTIGNPTLHPELVYTVGWSNMILGFFSINAQYAMAKNVYYSVTRNVPDTYFQETTYLNIYDENRLNLQIYLPFEFLKKRLRGYLSLNGAYMNYVNQKENVELNKNRKYLYMSSLFQYEIIRDLNLSTSFLYHSKSYYPQRIIDPYVRLRLDISYKINNMSLALSFYDILHTATKRKIKVYQGYSYSNYENIYMQYAMISFQYNFSSNNLKKKNMKNIDVSRFKD